MAAGARDCCHEDRSLGQAIYWRDLKHTAERCLKNLLIIEMCVTSWRYIEDIRGKISSDKTQCQNMERSQQCTGCEFAFVMIHFLFDKSSNYIHAIRLSKSNRWNRPHAP